MLLEVPYKVIANILKARLTVISEQLDHKMQNGFRPGRRTTDGIFNIKIVLRKMKEHGHAVWMLLLDLLRAFDRCPRDLLWPLMAKLGFPPNLIFVLQALHKTVLVKYDVDGVEKTIDSVIGVKQGGILGPILFNFLVAGAMMAWKTQRKTKPPTLNTTSDIQLLGGGNECAEVEEVEVPDSLYADDTAGELFLSREDLQADVPERIKLFAKFGLFVHVGTKEKKSKSVIVYHAAPRACYNDYSTFDGADFSDVDLGGGATMHDRGVGEVPGQHHPPRRHGYC
jgi:hypothetical protein